MIELYQQALSFYNSNDFESALNILDKCEPSLQVNALKEGCKTGLKAQYKYLIDEAVKAGDNTSTEEYINKYKKFVGQDQYILSILNSTLNHNNNKAGSITEQDTDDLWYDKEVAGIKIKILLIVLAIVFGFVIAFFICKEHDNNRIEHATSEDTVSDTTTGATSSYNKSNTYEVNEEVDEYSYDNDQNNNSNTEFNFRGKIKDKYEIYGTLYINSEGGISGKYCYISTYNKYGDIPSSWITLNGHIKGGEVNIRGIYYNNASEEEYWHGSLQQYDGEYSFNGQFESSDGTILNMFFRSI